MRMACRWTTSPRSSSRTSRWPRTPTSRSAGRPSSSSSRAPRRSCPPSCAAAAEAKIPLRVLGGGFNLLVRDEGVHRRRRAPRASRRSPRSRVEGKRVRAGCGAGAVGPDLAGGPRTASPASRRWSASPAPSAAPCAATPATAAATSASTSAGSRCSTATARCRPRERDELRFADHAAATSTTRCCSPAEFELEADSAEAIVKRMRKAWIQRKAAPAVQLPGGRRGCSRTRAACSAAALIEQAGLAGTRVGGAEVSDRNANYVIAHPGATRPRRAAADRLGAEQGAGALRGGVAARAERLVSRRRKEPAAARRRRTAWPVVAVVTAAAALVAAVVALGHLARDRLRGSDRYAVAFADIDCPAPPGLTRPEFLDEVPLPLAPRRARRSTRRRRPRGWWPPLPPIPGSQKSWVWNCGRRHTPRSACRSANRYWPSRRPTASAYGVTAAGVVLTRVPVELADELTNSRSRRWGRRRPPGWFA